jgi:hypothetical protein
MKANRIGVAGVALIGSLAFAGNALADTVIVTPAPQQSKTVVVKPKPNPVAATINAITKPDCDTTIKKTEGPRKTTTTVKKDCD